ncbi:DUF4190 domain-containing protein [Miltoncostaea oceani]|uniref:DUF4190 domain-containing protein n=1 Tax=Miltoncostaea oceani TaxID=2843216 RepID=UPI001C3CC903|nr:DUF4190 domain-containing protein [Miltoncostaea oceani]
MSTDALGSLMSGGGVPAAGTATTDVRPSSGKATAALVLGIVGLLLVPIVCSTLAIIFGALAMGDTSKDPQLQGRGQAIAGLVLGIVGLVAGVLLFMALMGGSDSGSGY